MKKLLILIVAVFVAGLFIAPNFAGATLDEAKAMVAKAEAYVKANGKEKALKAFNDPKGEFVKGELYVFAWDMNGTSIAHINPKQVGVNLLEVPDVDGKLFRKEAMEKAKKDGWAIVDYKFKNPKTGKVEQKTSYVKKMDDFIIGCGTYK